MDSPHSSNIKSARSTVKRLSDRGHYDQETVYGILDAHCICQVAFVHQGLPELIPTLYGRADDVLYFHGSVKSRMLELAAAGADLCVSVTLLDALVLARSGFHSSANYRSVVLYGKGEIVEDPSEKLHALAVISDQIIRGRWEEIRQPSENEMKATTVVKFNIREGAAKIRAAGVKDDPEDMNLPVWAGLLPLNTVAGEPVPDPKLPEGTPLPGYLAARKHRWS